MESRTHIAEPELDRQGRRFIKPGSALLAIACLLFVPGVLMLVLGHSVVFTIGIVLVALSLPFAAPGIAALCAAAVARWAARHKSFA